MGTPVDKDLLKNTGGIMKKKTQKFNIVYGRKIIETDKRKEIRKIWSKELKALSENVLIMDLDNETFEYLSNFSAEFIELLDRRKGSTWIKNSKKKKTKVAKK